MIIMPSQSLGVAGLRGNVMDAAPSLRSEPLDLLWPALHCNELCKVTARCSIRSVGRVKSFTGWELLLILFFF